MTSLIRFVLLLALAAVSGCATTLSPQADFDQQHNFLNYRTFAWVSPSPLVVAVGEKRTVSPLVENRIMRAVEEGLRAKGYRFVRGREQADFAVGFTVGARDKIQVTSHPDYYGGGWRWGGPWRGPYYHQSVDVRSYTEGTLAIDVFDVDSKRPVWHGWVSGRISNDAEKRRQLVDEAVAAILTQFPPG